MASSSRPVGVAPISSGGLDLFQYVVDEAPQVGVDRPSRLDVEPAAEDVEPGAREIRLGLAGGEAQVVGDQAGIGSAFGDARERRGVPLPPRSRPCQVAESRQAARSRLGGVPHHAP